MVPIHCCLNESNPLSESSETAFTLAYGADTNEDFPDHVDVARDALEDPDELMGYFLVAMTEGKTDYYSSTVLGGGTPVALATVKEIGELAQALLKHEYENGVSDRIPDELADVGALGYQLYWKRTAYPADLLEVPLDDD